MLEAKCKNGQTIMARCGCSHWWDHDVEKYGLFSPDTQQDGRVITVNLDQPEFSVHEPYATYCHTCYYYPWLIRGLSPDQMANEDRKDQLPISVSEQEEKDAQSERSGNGHTGKGKESDQDVHAATAKGKGPEC